MGCWKRAYMGDGITMDELLGCLLGVELYSLPAISKQRNPRGPGMKEDREVYGYGNMTKAIMYSALHDRNSPLHDEESRQGEHFRNDYGVPWQVFEDFVKKVQGGAYVN
jgi:hypothetical protein